MIKIENLETYGWEAAIRGMRNPMNSWDKSDSWGESPYFNFHTGKLISEGFNIGPNDLSLMQKLVKAGSDHSKFMRQIIVSMDITAPLYWWKEFDTYKVGTVANSCSTMHKIHEKVFDREDFSIEHLNPAFLIGFDETLYYLNLAREAFLESKDKAWWWQMIQLLPSSYNQRRTVTLNYAVLRNMYNARKNHKLDEWRTLCQRIQDLPYAKELICYG